MMNLIAIYSYIVIHAIVIVCYSVDLFFLRKIMKEFYTEYYKYVRKSIYIFFLVMILGMIVREVIFILIYLFYEKFGQGWVTSSFIEKLLLFLSEIIPCLFICLAVFYMKYD